MTGVQTCALPICPAHLLFGNKLDLNRGILTPHLSVGTHSRSTYISDLISVQDKVLETVVQALLKADAENARVSRISDCVPRGVICLMPIH